MSMTNDKHSAEGKRIKFKNPPINELVIALYHLPINELKAQHIGTYWDAIKSDYPTCEQQMPVILAQDGQPFLGFSMGAGEASGEIFPLPRFWFSSQEHSHLIQVQRNAFMLNWRQRSEVEYPHFESVYDKFWQEFDKYQEFISSIGGKIDVISRCEVTYINLIGKSQYFASPLDIGKVLPPVAGLTGVETSNRRLAGMNASATYQFSDTLLVEAGAKIGKRADNEEVVAALELKAFGTPSDLSLEGAREWCKTAHDAIYALFLDFTAKEVQQQVWEPV
jgi:uncharacterized protein (TIGR04255 family)